MSTFDNDLYREIYDSVNDGILVHDAESGSILDVNSTMCEMYGYRKDEALDLDIGDLSSGQQPYTQETAVERIRMAATGEPQVFDWHAKDSDGELFWVEVSMRRAVVDDRALVLVIVRDITERKERERELREQRDRLDEFASIVSHDLRNPLKVARGRVELARKECDSEHLEKATQAHDRMASLIDDLLTLSREGERLRDVEPVALADLARECWDHVETAEATLETEIDRSIRADRGRLKQLLENLIRNAVEHGGPAVTVTIGALDDGFFVEDDGDGVPAADRAEIFEAGFSTSVHGTGFGLSIVDRVVAAHGWEIEAVEGRDGGARFEIRGVAFAE